MNKRQLGKTNINLTAIGFGGAPLGNLFENLDERSCYDILEKTYETGVNIYDTSPLYGYGLSEHRLGNFLKTVDEELVLEYFISPLKNANSGTLKVQINGKDAHALNTIVYCSKL